MDVESKLRILADAAKYDASCASSGSTRKRPEGGLGNGTGIGICHSYTPDGRCISLLKILLTNYCVYDFSYYVNRVSSDTPRSASHRRNGSAHGRVLQASLHRRTAFLSSGVIQSANSTRWKKLIQVRAPVTQRASIRRLHTFGRSPGASRELFLEEPGAGRSTKRKHRTVDTSGPSTTCCAAKSHDEIETSMAQNFSYGITPKRGRARQSFVFAATEQQMICRRNGHSRRDHFEYFTSHLYSAHRLKRVYFRASVPSRSRTHVAFTARAVCCGSTGCFSGLLMVSINSIASDDRA